MFILKIRGARNSTLAYHRCDSLALLQELMAVYQTLGYLPEQMEVEERTEEKAA